GYLGGFIGLLLFGVVPGFFYSNLFGLGVVTKTQWLLMGGSNGSNMQEIQEMLEMLEMGGVPFDTGEVPFDIFNNDYQALIPSDKPYSGASNID
ncbi:MAG: hypothetical protein KAW45_09005, partial [Thermoplasmatales archaeon]|nr:hypothetical protein [Thermoplasmatales archaeon]